jgi:patatin-related protein
MAKKELRMAVVIYGGASLAVYMHGVTKELLNLVRASKVLHEIGAARAAGIQFADGPDRRKADTDETYFEILKSINRDQDFRVVIDAIAGASAGAINGVMLAKALVDDARLDAQTTLWLQGADSDRLAVERVGRWRKWYLYPVLRALAHWLPSPGKRETRRKLSRIVRSSWFRPPFSGERLCNLFFDALEALQASRREGSTLLPPGQRLDVYASLTDLAGHPRMIQLHEGLVAREREHAAYCRLTHATSAAGATVLETDFGDDNVPALVWAARASSSYAGAFPPFRHDELLRVLAARGGEWPGAARFIAENIRVRDGTAAARHFDPAMRYFVDGGIVNNKPFRAVLDALNHRPADRQVDRRLLYIEPDPAVSSTVPREPDLGYLATLHAAMSAIPRNQPIVDELHAIVAQDARVQVNRRLVEAHRPQIGAIARQRSGIHAQRQPTAELVTYLRAALEDAAETELGLAWDGYVQRRVWRLVDALVKAWSDLGGGASEPVLTRALETALSQWWADKDGAAERERIGQWRLHRQQSFLDHFDVSFRLRRLQFVIRQINQYQPERELPTETVERLDAFKRRTYEFAERCFRLQRAEELDDSLRAQLKEAGGRRPLAGGTPRALLQRLARSLDLDGLDRAYDAELAELLADPLIAPVRERLVEDYVGFPFFDVLLFGAGGDGDGPDPLTPIRVERISTADAQALTSAFDGLRCRAFLGFLGFFNRAYREHDYLWGRLHGADRLVDILADVAGDAIGDTRALKQALFRAIVATERGRLRLSAADLDRVAEAIGGRDEA